jgi:general secretion pathway protein I
MTVVGSGVTKPCGRFDRQRQGGFTLLEVIVALVLVSTAGMAYIAWLNQGLATLARLQEYHEQIRLRYNALALLDVADPSRDGELAQTPLLVSWRSSLRGELQPNRGFGGQAAGIWRVGLFKLRVIAVDQQSGARVEFEVLKAHGLKQ